MCQDNREFSDIMGNELISEIQKDSVKVFKIDKKQE